MLTIALVLAALAALIHYYIFWLESIAFEGPGRKVFGITREEAAALKQVFYNQGFYNLFLAIGTTVGIVLYAASHTAGGALVTFGCSCMLGAALVLVSDDPTKRRAGLVQGLAPALALAFLGLAAVS
ncbi:DUF1304 domain-containing protein [Nocardioides montaniterrae]